MNEEVPNQISNVSTGGFAEKSQFSWKKWLIIIAVIAVLVFLFYPRAYAYNLEDTCNSQFGVVNARCIGVRLDWRDRQEKTLDGDSCLVDKQGQRCLGLSLFEKLN